jgi:hypothetical protein
MNCFRTGKLRFLYLLALAQLVGGPLVLLQVTVFCKLTLHEAPRMGMANAAVHTWQSKDFQTVLTATAATGTDDTQSMPPCGDPKGQPDKSKTPISAWEPAPLVLINLSGRYKSQECARTWTPAWPQAPPGPPPRVG